VSWADRFTENKLLKHFSNSPTVCGTVTARVRT
jgi:hypothetical protein